MYIYSVIFSSLPEKKLVLFSLSFIPQRMRETFATHSIKFSHTIKT